MVIHQQGRYRRTRCCVCMSATWASGLGALQLLGGAPARPPSAPSAFSAWCPAHGSYSVTDFQTCLRDLWTARIPKRNKWGETLNVTRLHVPELGGHTGVMLKSQVQKIPVKNFEIYRWKNNKINALLLITFYLLFMRAKWMLINFIVC